jgi:hypothetical protein
MAERSCRRPPDRCSCGQFGIRMAEKDPQYVERAAPTRALIDVLKTPDLRVNSQLPLQVCGFSLHSWIGQETVAGFT